MSRSFASAAVLTAVLAAACGQPQEVAAPAPAKTPAPVAPVTRKPAEGVVAQLYQQHAKDASPFFQTTSRELVDTYFEKSLADLIWSDAVAAAGEVGALGFDPLYDAQDTEIKNFVIAPAAHNAADAQVVVTFDNFGERQKITWSLVPSGDGWKISDVTYGDGRTLRDTYTTNLLPADSTDTTGSR